MIAYPSSLKSIGGARTGIAPVNLLEIQDINGNLYFFSDRKISVTSVIGAPIGTTPYIPVGARTARITMTATKYVGQENDGYADNINLQINGDANLVVGGDAENGMTGWTLGVGGMTTAEYGAPNLVTTFPPAPSPDCGSYLFYGGGNFPVSVATQEINLSEYAADIDASSATFLLSAYLGGYTTQTDDMTVQCDWIDSYNDVLGSAIIGPVTNVDRANVSELLLVSTTVTGSNANTSAAVTFEPWLLTVGSLAFHRSLQTDVGSFIIQNLSGDTLARDMERKLRASAMEGAFFVYRLWQPDAEAAWLEVHGTLTVDEVGVDTLTLKASSLLNPSQDDTPLEIYCETCQLQWGGKRCGSTQTTECDYSFQTCQVVERIMVALNDYEKNFGEATANVTTNRVINRRRRI